MIDIFANIRSQIVGEGLVFASPYGPRRMTYTDHAASGRAYAPVEAFVYGLVLPFYANTHTETTITGAQTTAFREEARAIVKESCGATAADACIFTGNGVTGAVHTLAACLGLACKPRDGRAPSPRRPVVFIGKYEHHSNELPWRELDVEVVVVNDCAGEGIDLDDLDRQLKSYGASAYGGIASGGHRLLIGSFSAASNVTGRITDTAAVARALHHRGALACFDYAAAGPYADVAMNPSTDELAYKDAVFLSLHKFVGGPGAPGVLLAKKHLFANRVPAVPGGGTVAFVAPDRHRYLEDVEHREEGGTPNIVGCIRAGLAMTLKQSVGSFAIMEHEQTFARETIAAWREDPNIKVLGDLDEPRLGIVSFLVTHTPLLEGAFQAGEVVEHQPVCIAAPCPPRRAVVVDGRVRITRRPAWTEGTDPYVNPGPPKLHPEKDVPEILVQDGSGEHWLQVALLRRQVVTKHLHHNFVVALLNDLFGIQARGGNSCAAPYAHRLLGVTDEAEARLEQAVAAGGHGVKPGWTRVSFGWYDSEATLRFVIEAVRFVAQHGWRFLPDYSFNPSSGTWTHRGAHGAKPAFLGLAEALASPVLALATAPEEVRLSYLQEALALAAAPRPAVPVVPTPYEALRWFWLPGELS